MTVIIAGDTAILPIHFIGKVQIIKSGVIIVKVVDIQTETVIVIILFPWITGHQAQFVDIGECMIIVYVCFKNFFLVFCCNTFSFAISGVILGFAGMVFVPYILFVLIGKT